MFCLARVCLAYSVDLPAALESTIINVMRVDITQYELLYSLYSWPNVFLAVIGGVLIDRVFGLRLGLLIFITIACIGQLLVAMGGYFNQFWLMVLADLCLVVGLTCPAVLADIFAAALFQDSELSVCVWINNQARDHDDTFAQTMTALVSPAVMSCCRKFRESVVFTVRSQI